MPRAPYAAHETLVAPARPGRALWRLLAGIAMVMLIAYGLNAALVATLSTLASEFWGRHFVMADGQGTTPASLLILLGSFGFLSIGVAAAAAQMHGRSFLGLIGPLRPALRQSWQALRALILLGLALAILPPWGAGDAGAEGELVQNLDPALWVSLLPLSLLAVLIQSGSEEVLFRGYIQSQLAARFSSPAIWLLVPSALFAAGHYVPAQAGPNAAVIALWAFAFGLAAADLTARAGTLGPAITMHFANNLASILIVALPDNLSGLALFTVPYSMDDADQLARAIPIEFAMILVTWLAVRVSLRR